MLKRVMLLFAVIAATAAMAAVTLPTEFLGNFQIPGHNYKPEGVFWDPTSQQFYFSSTQVGAIYSIRLGFSDLAHSVVRMVDPNSLGLGTWGIYVDNGSNRYVLWSALSDFRLTGNSAPVQGGLLRVDMLTGVSTVVSLAQFQTGNGLFINDVVTDDAGNVYATNTFDGQIFKGTYNATTGKIDVSQFFYNANYRFNGFGMNGIEFYNGWLLVGITQDAAVGGGVLRINATDPTQYSMMKVNNGLFDRIDGLRFNSDKSILYGARNPDNLVAAVSTDNWATAQVIQNFTLPANCPTFISTVAHVPSVNHQFVMCTSSLSTGPYAIAQFN